MSDFLPHLQSLPCVFIQNCWFPLYISFFSQTSYLFPLMPSVQCQFHNGIWSSSPSLYSTVESSLVMLVWVPGLGRSFEIGHGNPFQYSCLENPMNRGTWQATESIDSQGVGQNWSHLACPQAYSRCMSIPIPRNNLLKIMQQPKWENNLVYILIKIVL